MARTDEISSHGMPNLGEAEGWRHFGDGIAGRFVAARIQGYYASGAAYRDIAVNDSGELTMTASVSASTEYTEDAAAAADPVGGVQILVRKDTPSTTVTTDGDNIAQRGTNYGAAYVTLLDTTGSAVSVGGGTQYDEDTASTAADKLTMAGVVRKDTAATLVDTDGDRTQLQVNAAGKLWVDAAVTVALPAGANAIGKLAANDGVDIGDVTLNNASVAVTIASVPSHAVTNAGTFAVQAAITAASGSIGSGALASGSVASGAVASGAFASGALSSGAVASGAVASGAFASGALASGSIAAGAVAAGATSFVKLEDVASADADAGVPALAVRKATPANTSGTDGDYEFLQMSAGRLWASANNDQINGVTPLMGAGNTGTGSLRMTLATDQANLTTPLNTFLVPQTSGGLLIACMTSGDGSTALTNSAQAIKASAGQLFGWYIYNPNATAAYVPIYNTAAASVTVGTTNPVMVLTIPATSAANVLGETGIQFTNAGWSVAAATTGGGNTAPTTALEANFFYK